MTLPPLLEVFVLCFLGCGATAGVIAVLRGGNVYRSMLLGVLLGPIGLFIVAAEAEGMRDA